MTQKSSQDKIIVDGDNVYLIAKDPPKFQLPPNARLINPGSVPTLKKWAEQNGLVIEKMWIYDYASSENGLTANEATTTGSSLPPPEGGMHLTSDKTWGGLTIYTHYNVDYVCRLLVGTVNLSRPIFASTLKCA